MTSAYTSRLPILLATLLILAGCAAPPDAPQQHRSPVVATVNGETIDSDYFKESYVDFLIMTGQNDSRVTRYAHLDNLIDVLLLASEARAAGLDRDSSIRIFQEREVLKAVGGVYFDDAFLSTLPELSDDEKRRAFALSKEQRVVRHLFFRDESSVVASYNRLLGGSAFEDEAQTNYQLAEYDSSAGRLGVVTFYQLDPAFAEAAFSTPIDSFSGPVRSRFGYHIVFVDDAFSNPLITESEYQTRKEGIASKFRLHRRMLEGDRFVRRTMEELNVEVDAAAIRALDLALLDLENSVEPKPVQIQSDVEAAAGDLKLLRDGLQPSTVLARYEIDGKSKVFTAGDYYFWLPELPFQEARSRPAASVGRALRNAVFAERGEARKLRRDPRVTELVGRSTRQKLADELRLRLRATTALEPSEDELRAAFVQARFDQRKDWTATFWYVPFQSRATALAAVEAVRRGTKDASAYAGYERYVGVELSDFPEWQGTVVGARDGDVQTVGFGSDVWYAFAVEEKSSRPVELSEVTSELASAITPFIAEYRLLRKLRRNAVIDVDTTAFVSLMQLRQLGQSGLAGQKR